MTNSSIARACGLIGVGFVACLASAKEVTLTISNVTSQPIVAYLDENGVWTLDADGSPCTKEDLAEGDTLTVSCGSYNGHFFLQDFSTPRLAKFVFKGTGAINLCNFGLNLQDDGVIDVSDGRMILLDGFAINAADRTLADMKTVVRTGSGILQLRVAQSGFFRFDIRTGENYVHSDGALGPEYPELVPDSIRLADGVKLHSGFNNTAVQDVRLPVTHGITIADGASVEIGNVKGETTANDFSMYVKGPISGKNVNLTLYSADPANQYVGISGCNDGLTGTLTLNGKVKFLPGVVLDPGIALASAGIRASLYLCGNDIAVKSLDISKRITGLYGPGTLKLDCSFGDLPNVACYDGASLAISGTQPAGDLSVSAGTVARVYPESSAAIAKSGEGELRISGAGRSVERLDVDAGSVVLDSAGEAAKSIAVSSGASVAASGGPLVYEFRFSRAVGSTDGNDLEIWLSEISLTKGSIPIDTSLYDVEASSVSDGSTVRNLLDGAGNTFWRSAMKPDGTSYVAVRVALKAVVAVDGYMLGTGEAQSGIYNPKSWEVYEVRNGISTRIDHRADVVLMSDNLGVYKVGTYAPKFAFQDATGGAPISSGTEIALASGSVFTFGGGAATLGKLSGLGTLVLCDRAELTVDDLSDWRGEVVSFDSLSVLRLGGSGSVNAVEVGQSRLVMEGAAGSAVSVALDGAVPGALRGKLSNGPGSLGLVKEGDGEAFVTTEDAEATGEVAVRSGTLKVSARRAKERCEIFSARYIRFQPLTRIGGAATYNWELGEFEIVNADGTAVTWPAGTSITPQYSSKIVDIGKIINGNFKDRACAQQGSAPTFDDLQYFTIDMKTQVEFCGYRLYPPYNADWSYDADRNRMVKTWKVLISNDGNVFREIDSNSLDPNELPATWAEFDAASPIAIGPYFKRFPASENEIGGIPESLLVADEDVAVTRAVAVRARYFRFQPFLRYGNNVLTGGDFGIAISEFDLYRNGERIAWDGASATSDSTYYNGTAQDAVDNDFMDRCYATRVPHTLTVDAGRTVEFDAYGFHNDCNTVVRAPIGWRLSVSEDGQIWHEVDVMASATLGHGASEAEGPWSVADKWQIPSRQNVLGDDAPVSVADGACLWFNTDYERIGALTGCGTVSLYDGSTVDIHAGRDGAFEGAVDGSGAIVKSGTGTQVLSVSPAIRTITLREGALVANGNYGGADLEIVFADGSLGGSMTGIGRLSIAGDVRIAYPEAGEKIVDLLSWSDLGEGAAEKLAAAALVGTRARGYRCRLFVEGNTLKLEQYRPGCAIILR